MGAGEDDVELQKSNILLLGPTGCGKTLLAQTLARILNVPFAIADATALTEAGYVGEDVENILLKLIQAADFDIKKAETGIIYIDEVDKIARKADNPSITRDVSGEGVQQALLKILEGTVASVPPQGGRKHPHQEFLSIDTTNILFICGGAFAGLEKIIERRIGKNAVGFGAEIHSKHSPRRSELLAAGDARGPARLRADPRVHRPPARRLGRAPAAARGPRPDPRRSRRTRSSSSTSASSTTTTIELVFTEDALWAIADKALERETGARGLRSIIEDALLDVMFELPSRKDVSKCVITKETIAEGHQADARHERRPAGARRPAGRARRRRRLGRSLPGRTRSPRAPPCGWGVSRAVTDVGGSEWSVPSVRLRIAVGARSTAVAEATDDSLVDLRRLGRGRPGGGRERRSPGHVGISDAVAVFPVRVLCFA